MIKCKEFNKYDMSDKKISYQIEDFCRENSITRDMIISVQYAIGNWHSIVKSALLVYEE